MSAALPNLAIELGLVACLSAGAVEGVVGSAEATMLDHEYTSSNPKSIPWNKGRLTG
jgi:hypothetical protein